MTEEDGSADPKAREEKTQDKKGDVHLAGKLPSEKDEIKRKIEEEARAPEDVSITTEELKEYEHKRAVKVTIIAVISFILVCLTIVGILITNEGILYLFGILFFLLLIITLSSLIDRWKGRRNFIDYLSLSERYRFYLNKLNNLLFEYNKRRQKESKKYYAKRIRYCITHFYFLSINWGSFSIDSNKPAAYIDLFTHNLDEFNLKLRILLLRLNGFIGDLENVPEEVYKELKRLVNYLDENSGERTTGHLNCLNHSIDYLEKNYPRVWKEVIHESFVSKTMKRLWEKISKWLKVTFIWLGTAAIYWVCITWFDFGITNDTKFIFFGTLWGAWLYVLYLIFKER